MKVGDRVTFDAAHRVATPVPHNPWLTYTITEIINGHARLESDGKDYGVAWMERLVPARDEELREHIANEAKELGVAGKTSGTRH